MIRVHITNKAGNQFFQDMPDSEVPAYKQLLADKQLFGRPAWVEKLLVTPEIRDAEGNISVPEVTQEIPHSAEYTIVEEDITVQLASEKDKQEALKLLADTDWYIIRELDSGVPCPPNIKAARQAAREKI